MTLQIRTEIDYTEPTDWIAPLDWLQGTWNVWERLRSPYHPDMWVQLCQPPTESSFDQAWLLCEVDRNSWLAWVPDYGELVVNTAEFCDV